METYTVDFGKNHWTKIFTFLGTTRKNFLSCPKIYAGFHAPAIISGCVKLDNWIMPTGQVVSIMQSKSDSKVTTYESLEKFISHMKEYENYDRAMTPDPETGRRSGLYK